ncbi:unknown protein [Seminavis robusta]|uniref:Uncharacterized protein n=1 Tax=Seminavis robusta TaxID=568900 RepID=A0A9N8DST1_9STRA|nr:unknown protein [Seminavis robusta]|eukprot:Sro263_g102201.1  (137) ;mRNA; r:21430-21840
MMANLLVSLLKRSLPKNLRSKLGSHLQGGWISSMQSLPQKWQLSEHWNSIEISILWQGNPISTVKTFGTRHCSLCNRERLEILKRSRESPEKLINSCNEIYGACRINLDFISTTIAQALMIPKGGEKVKQPKVITE